MKNAIVISAALIALLFASCKTTESVTPVDPEIKTLSDAGLIGQTLYQEHCDKCHELPVVANYSKNKWSHIVPDMSHKAELNASQEESIMTFVMEQLVIGDTN